MGGSGPGNHKKRFLRWVPMGCKKFLLPETSLRSRDQADLGAIPTPEVKPFHLLGVLWVVLRDLSGSVVEVEI